MGCSRPRISESFIENLSVARLNARRLIPPGVRPEIGIAMEHALAYRAATADDVRWLADTFIRSLRSAIKKERGCWDETKECDQFLTAQIVRYQRSGFRGESSWLLHTVV